jgi:hypothetical protein
MKLKDKDLIITSVYRPPDANQSTPFDDLIQLHTDLQSQYPNAIRLIVGDFNCHSKHWLGSNNTDIAGQEAENMALLLKMEQLINKPTRHSADLTTSNILDLLFTTHPQRVIISHLPPLGKSDHSLISASLAERTPTIIPAQPRLVFNYKKANWTRLRKSFRLIRWRNLIHPSNTTTSALNIEKQILLSMRLFIPNRTLKSNPSTNQPWYTAHCSESHSKLLKTWKTLRKDNTKLNRDKYKQAKRGHLLTLHNEYRLYVQRLNDNLRSSQSSSQWWKQIRKANPTNSPIITSMRSTTGSTAFSSTEIANILNEQFVSNSTCPTSNAPPPQLPSTTSIIPKLQITRQKVLAILKQLDTTKATGPDGIPNLVLRKCAHQLAHPLALLFRQSLKLCTFPDHWKTASVVPIYKNGPRDEASNYRPISLLPNISKILEVLVNSHIVEFLEKSNLLSTAQFGFRAKRSTCDLLVTLTQKWSDTLNKGGKIIVVTLDFSKAFDRVWHEGLLRKLHAYGIQGDLHKWLTNYLSNRSQFVLYRGSKSSTLPISAGVPQGSVLGPTLFLIAINDLPTVCKNPVGMFADDCTLHRPVYPKETIQSASTNIQNDLNALSEWANSNRAQFNPKKCEVLLISNQRLKQNQQTPSLFLNNIKIPNVDKIKLLGLQLDNRLHYGDHVHNLATKGSRALGAIYKTAQLLQEDYRARIYKTLIRPLLEYASPIWCGAPQSTLTEIDKIQKRSLNLLRLTDANKFNIPPMQARFHTASVLLFRKHYLNPPIPSDPLVIPTLPSAFARATTSGHDRPVQIPPSRTASHQQSFIPRTSRQWNDMPAHVAAFIDRPNFGSIYYNHVVIARSTGAAHATDSHTHTHN